MTSDALLEGFHDPELCKKALEALRELDQPLRFMEVCGTHTVSIFQSGLHSLLPKNMTHLTGPGCPVCVTHDREVAAFLEMAARDDVVIATFGDLMRVPGPGGKSLKSAQAEGARVKVVYSPLDSLQVAKDHPGDTVVFLGVGFETTAPAVAATIKAAKAQGLENFTVFACHKLVPPALAALVDGITEIDGFLLPGHVSAVIGLAPYQFLGSRFGKPAAITGFEPVDILQALLFLAGQKKSGSAEVTNLYRRAVGDQGNARAVEIMHEVFDTADALWRGLGVIPQSGLELSAAYRAFDARERLEQDLPDVPPLKGCKCGEVLKGIIPPSRCPLFSTVCTPASPVGPCMVSTEGSCAAYYKYQLDL